MLSFFRFEGGAAPRNYVDTWGTRAQIRAKANKATEKR